MVLFSKGDVGFSTGIVWYCLVGVWRCGVMYCVVMVKCVIPQRCGEALCDVVVVEFSGVECHFAGVMCCLVWQWLGIVCIVMCCLIMYNDIKYQCEDVV